MLILVILVPLPRHKFILLYTTNLNKNEIEEITKKSVFHLYSSIYKLIM